LLQVLPPALTASPVCNEDPGIMKSCAVVFALLTSVDGISIQRRGRLSNETAVNASTTGASTSISEGNDNDTTVNASTPGGNVTSAKEAVVDAHFDRVHAGAESSIAKADHELAEADHLQAKANVTVAEAHGENATDKQHEAIAKAEELLNKTAEAMAARKKAHQDAREEFHEAEEEHDEAVMESNVSAHPAEANTSLVQMPCPFGGEGGGKSASKEEANNFFDGFAKAYDKTHGIKADKAQANASIAEAKGTGFVQGVSLRARLQSWIQRRIQDDDAPTMAKLIFSASSPPKISASQISVHHGEGSPEETLTPIGEGAYQSADAVAQRTTDSRKHCEDAVIYKSANWQDCFKDAGDYIDGPSHGYASAPARSGAVFASPMVVGVTIVSTLAATLVMRF